MSTAERTAQSDAIPVSERGGVMKASHVFGAASAAALLLAATIANAAKPVKFADDYTVTGLYLGDCGDFAVLWDLRVALHGKLFLDEDGVPEAQVAHFDWSEGVVYRSDDPSIFIESGPGVVGNQRITGDDGVPENNAFSGLGFKITIPGEGVISLEAGRVVYDEFLNVTFLAGPADFTNQEVGAICNVLRQ
jgi:hypothetical protein